MAHPVPTVKEVYDSTLANIEAAINQTTPTNDKSYNRVLAQNESGNLITLYHFGVQAAKECLALTANERMDELMSNYGLIPKAEVRSVLTFTLPATSGGGAQVTPADFLVGDANGVQYYPNTTYTESAGVITITATALTAGIIGNLLVSDTLTLGHNIPGAETVATITAIVTLGAEPETLEAKRIRLLNKIRAPGGGGDMADYRNWSLEAPNTYRTYPYALDYTYLETGVGTPDYLARTVYVESTTDYNVDGLADAALLASVKSYIETDPDTGKARQPLPLGSSNLYVRSIIRTQFYVEITGLTVDADVEAACKADITTALQTYFRSLFPFLDGLDYIGDKRNTVTAGSISLEVQNVVYAYGGSFQFLEFNYGASNINEYLLQVNELGKLATGGVSYL